MKIKIIHTTTDNIAIAQTIANTLVNNNLSPCVQIIPKIISIYKWNNKLNSTDEYLIVIKTFLNNIKKCQGLIEKLHNYDTPEIIVHESEILNNKYKIWFNQNLDSN